MNHSIFLVVDLNELAKATGVVVMYCLGIAKGLQIKHRIAESQSLFSFFFFYASFQLIAQ